MLDYTISVEESTRRKLLNVLKIAIPSTMTFFFQFLSEVINTYFLGQLNDPRILAGAGMGNIIISMMCLSVFQGMNGALETFISQSIGVGNH
jgi:Na+-driven multidrug efflux pump